MSYVVKSLVKEDGKFLKPGEEYTGKNPKNLLKAGVILRKKQANKQDEADIEKASEVAKKIVDNHKDQPNKRD